jgi:hypothetical protein
MATIAFDVDDTLIKKDSKGRDIPRYEVIQLVISFLILGNKVILWSGGGEDYAKTWSEKLGFGDSVEIRTKKKDLTVDICFDDMEVDLATVNIRV